MKGSQAIALIVVLIVIAGIVVAKSAGNKSTSPPPTANMSAPEAPVASPPPTPEASNAVATAEPAASAAAEKPAEGKPLPKMLELGSVGCIPCQHMAPIIDALQTELAGKVDIKFHDVNENPGIADQYKIQVIPTQIFLDADGKELFRHVGVFEKEEILAKLRELGMLKE